MAAQLESSQDTQPGPDAFDYVYEKLPTPRHIRILQLDPGHFDDLVSLSLIPVSLSSLPDFEALSYTWGDVTIDPKTVLCGGRLLSIGRNLHDALRHLREPKRGRLLWADAICINQKDIAERNQQVQLMVQIYSAASKTLIWLGEETERNCRALYALERFHEVSANIDWGAFLEMEKPDPRFAGLLTTAFGTPMPSEMIDLGHLFSLPWFSRKWIVQELLLSIRPVIVLGHRQVPWAYLEMFIRYVGKYGVEGLMMIPYHDGPRPSQYYIHAGMLYAGRVSRNNIPTSLLHNVAFFCSFSCKDPRDHIIACLGTSDDVSPADLVLFADYNRSREDLFLLFTKRCIFEKQDLGIFSLRSLLPAESTTLPSWIPDLEALSLTKPRIPLYRSGDYRASLASKISASISQESLLSLEGRILDTISQVGNLELTAVWDMPAVESPKDLVSLIDYSRGPKRFIDELERIFSWPEEPEFGDITPKRGLLSYLISGVRMNSRAASLSEKRITFLRTLVGDFNSQYSVTDLVEFERTMRGGQITWGMERFGVPFAIMVMLVIQREAKSNRPLGQFMFRRFCRSQQGRFGWVPRSTEEGDLICIFNGSPTPHIIRRTREGRYILLGDCYIQGLMIGEGMQLASVETIVLE